MYATHRHRDSEVKYEIYFDSDWMNWRLRGRIINIELNSERMKRLIPLTTEEMAEHNDTFSRR